MLMKTASIVMLALLVMSTLALAYDIQLVRADGVVTIKSDGYIDPSTANITTLDNTTYTFIGNIIGELIDVERGNIVIDGNGYTVQGNGLPYGFMLNQVNNVTIKNMNIANFIFGIYIQNSSRTFVTEDNITYCGGYGVYESYSNFSTISTSNVTSCGYAGIFSYLSNYTVLSDNNVSNNKDGIKMWDSLDIAINGNTISGNDGAGISIEGSYNAINGNTISGNNGTGISIGGSLSDVIDDNTVIGNLGVGISIYGSPNEKMNHNTVNNNNNTGIWLYNCSDALVNGSSISGNNGDGIHLASLGPVPMRPGLANVTDNQISYNTGNGIYMYDFHGGRVQGNQLENNTNGIVITGVIDYILTNNYLVNQSSYGIQMFTYSRDNTIYHNDFVNNKNLVEIDGSSSVRSWNDSYPSGGNYWSDYTGNDTKKGPNQNINGQDGIGDTPYVIDVNNHDNYPLSPSTQPSHDIGLLNPEQWKTFVCQGFPLCTYGSIINYGNNDENASIIAYANGVQFDSKNFTLQARTWNATGFDFTSRFGWNTTSLVKYVNYSSLIFCLCPVAGETETADNNFTGGWFEVTIAGDVNGDRKVDGKDLGWVAWCFGSYPGSPTIYWNPNCDINNDGHADGKDLGIVAEHFGEPPP